MTNPQQNPWLLVLKCNTAEISVLHERRGCFFFPASGARVGSSGSSGSVAAYGFYWFAAPASGVLGYYLDSHSLNVSLSKSTFRSFGMPVRCLQEFTGRPVLQSMN